MKKLIFTLLLSLASVYVWAQESQGHEQSTQEITTPMPGAKNYEHKDHSDQQKTIPVKRPNYGSLVVDWGFNFLRDHPSEMDLKHLGSRFASGSIHYNIRLGHSHFVISPGIGIAFNSYQFENKENTLVRDEASRNTMFQKASLLFPKSSKIIGSAFDIRYINIVLEARFNANSKYPKESFFVAIGGKLSWLWRASTTVKYREDNAIKTQSNTESFNLNKTRDGFHVRLGWRRFGLCYTHMLSSLFEKDKGPDNSTTKTQSIALSVDLL